MEAYTSAPVLHLTEKLILPAPGKWTPDKNTSIEEGGRVAVTKYMAIPDRGLVYEEWGFDENDPKGEYRFEIYYRDELIYAVSFQVR